MVTVTLTEIATLNSVSAFALGVPLNAGLLFWAIRQHTPGDLRPYARLLRQTCVTDLTFLLTNLIVSPVNLLLYTPLISMKLYQKKFYYFQDLLHGR
jgi:uncharacterized membrane protein